MIDLKEWIAWSSLGPQGEIFWETDISASELELKVRSQPYKGMERKHLNQKKSVRC